MRILYITAEVPWPLTSGYLRHFHFVRALGERHDVTHFSLTSRPALADGALEALDPYVDRLVVFGLPREPEPAPPAHPGIPRRLRKLLRRRRAVGQMKRAVHELLRSEPIDVVVLSGKPTFRAVADVDEVPIVVDACDAASLRIRGEMRFSGPQRRLELLLRLPAALRVERRSVRKTSQLAFASIRDQRAMTGSTRRGEVVPQAVDLEYWRPGSTARRPSSVLFHGALRYPPNDDAAIHLVEEIGPLLRDRVPDLEVFVVGRDPSPRLLAAAAERPWATITGEVEDMRPYFDSATIYCAPLRFASGIQNKLLEALAMGLPVVTTPVAAAGLSVDGAEPPLAVAEGSQAVAEEALRLLEHEDERARLASAGRRFVEEHFTWERSIGKLERLCEEAVAEFVSRRRAGGQAGAAGARGTSDRSGAGAG